MHKYANLQTLGQVQLKSFPSNCFRISPLKKYISEKECDFYTTDLTTANETYFLIQVERMYKLKRHVNKSPNSIVNFSIYFKLTRVFSLNSFVVGRIFAYIEPSTSDSKSILSAGRISKKEDVL